MVRPPAAQVLETRSALETARAAPVRPAAENNVMQIRVRVGMVASTVVIVAAATVTLPQESLTLEQTRALLDYYRSESVQSVHRPDYALPRLRELKPTDHLQSLYRSRDSAVLQLRGSFWAEVCKATGEAHCVEPLIEGLSDYDPVWRAFACRALESLRVREAVPALVGLLTDDAVVEGVLPESTVAMFAAAALASTGRDDGVSLLLEQAARTKAFWDRYPYLPAFPSGNLKYFRELSGRDFGDDLESWKEWFEGNREQLHN